MLSVRSDRLPDGARTGPNGSQQDEGRAILVPAVEDSPGRSVAVTLTDTAVTDAGMSVLAPTHDPFPESVKVTVRVEEADEPVRGRVAVTLLRADSSVTGTWSERFAQPLPLKRTVMVPSCGGRRTAPSRSKAVAGAPVTVTRAATVKRPSGNTEALVYDDADARAKVILIVVDAPAARFPDEESNEKKDG